MEFVLSIEDFHDRVLVPINNMALSLDQAIGNPILLSVPDCQWLYEIAAGFHDEQCDKEAYAIQTGTYRGGSACIIAQGLKYGGLTKPLIAIDSFEQVFDKSKPETTNDIFLAHKQLIEALNLEKHIMSVWHDSIRFLEFLSTLNPIIRFAFIDSVHLYQHIIKELAGIYPLLCKHADSWIIFHDYGGPLNNVTTAVDDFVQGLGLPNVTTHIPYTSTSNSSMFVIHFHPTENNSN